MALLNAKAGAWAKLPLEPRGHARRSPLQRTEALSRRQAKRSVPFDVPTRPETFRYPERLVSQRRDSPALPARGDRRHVKLHVAMS